MSKVTAKYRIRRNRILRTLLEHGELSLTDLARETGMSVSMVSGIVASEKHGKFIHTREGREPDHAGRPPILACLNGESGYVLGIDLGHLNTDCVLLNLAQDVVAERHEPSPALTDGVAVLDWITHRVNQVLQDASVPGDRLLGVGISIPGIVRGREGTSETYLNFGERSVRDILHERLKRPVHIEHDAKAMALGEWWFGSARNVRDALCLNIGWGLGLGILLDGRLTYGRDGYAGEFGHIEVVPDGSLCYCGRRGCLETVASGRAIGRMAQERLRAGAVSLLADAVKGDTEKVDAQLVVEMAVAGDQFSIEILDEAGRYLGEGIATLINLFNPQIVVLGGRVAGAGDYILNPVRTNAVKHSLGQLARNVAFTISTLGTKAGALGVGMLAARDLFEVDHLNPSAFV